MNRYVNIGLAFGMSAFLGAAAHLSAQAKPETAKPATQKPQTAKPATEQSSQSGPVNLGEVRIPRDVRAGGKRCPPAPIRCVSRKRPLLRRRQGRRRNTNGGPSSCAAAKWWRVKWSQWFLPAKSSKSPSRRRRQPAGIAPKCSRATTTCGCGSTAAEIITWRTSIS